MWLLSAGLSCSVFDVGGEKEEEYQIIEAGHPGKWPGPGRPGGRIHLPDRNLSRYHCRVINTLITPNTNMQLTKCNGN